MPLCYLSHHKCATMYANAVLGRICAELGLTRRTVYRSEEFAGDLIGYGEQERADLICYLDAEWEYARDLDGLRAVHVIRDPRDILVSAYFSHLHSHDASGWERLPEHRRKLRSVSKEEGLFLEIDFTGYVFRALERWEYGREGVLELRYEELADRPYDFWLRVTRHLDLLDEQDFGLRRSLAYSLRGLINLTARRLGLPPWQVGSRRVPAQRLLGIVHDNRFEKKSRGRARGEADPKSHYRKGESGDWRNHLTDGHVARLNADFPRLLEKTGYARDQAAGADVGS